MKATSPPDGADSPRTVKTRRHLLPLLKARVWLEERFHPTELQITLLWAGLVGFCGGLSSILFRKGTNLVHLLLTGSDKNLVTSFTEMPHWQRFITTVMGGAPKRPSASTSQPARLSSV